MLPHHTDALLHHSGSSSGAEVWRVFPLLSYTHDNRCKNIILLLSNSSLQQSTYDKIAEVTMEGLLDELQNILDSHGDSSLEVEYNVRPFLKHAYFVISTDCPCSIEWCHDSRPRPARHVCDQ